MVLFWTVVKLLFGVGLACFCLSMVLFWTVVKHYPRIGKKERMFEYGVILNGSQTATASWRNHWKFEYGVILNGSQT